MSNHEDYARRELLEQDQALLLKVEGFRQDKHSDTPPAQTEPAASDATDWPDPEPLGGELPAVPVFDLALLPDSLRPLAADAADRMQVPLDYPAVVSVLCLAGLVNRRATIQPKASDTSWLVVLNLWGGIIAPPGLMKSPLITLVTRPLTRIEALWRTEYESARAAAEEEKEVSELRRAAWREQYKAAQKTVKTHR